MTSNFGGFASSVKVLLVALTLDAKRPKFDVNDNLRKVSIGRKLRERLLKAGITRSSFYYNLFAPICLVLSHLNAIFLFSFLPDESVWVFSPRNCLTSHTQFFTLKVFTWLVRNFFSICRGYSDMCFVNLLGLRDARTCK